MVGLVLVGHAPFAAALSEAAAMIFGEQEHVYALNLNHDTNLDAFTEQVRAATDKAQQGDGVLVLADLLGGSPGNAASYLASNDVAIVTGASLPMLLEVLGSRHLTLPELVRTACRAGASGITYVNDLLRKE